MSCRREAGGHDTVRLYFPRAVTSFLAIPLKIFRNELAALTSYSLEVYTNIQEHDKVLSVQHHHMLCVTFLGDYSFR